MLGAGEAVSPERLVDAIWGDRPPRSAAKNVQNCVLRLRKAFGAEVIETCASGYRLATDAAGAASVDARRFEGLVARGRAARLNGMPDRAVTALREALGLWRGRPYADLEGWEPAAVEVARLCELRRVAQEEVVDAELACGNAETCVGELEAMTTEEPFREHRWAQLMLALYRSGRQADALRAYQRARTVLVAELGIEPGPELRALERAIVDQDSSLAMDLPASAGTPARGGVRSGSDEVGVVFILFSDIVASTEVLDRLGDEAAEGLRRAHFRVLRDAVAGHEGREVKSTGDGLMAVFASGAEAVAGALAMRRAVAEGNRAAPEPLRMRIGLHVGEPLSDEDDLYGKAVVVARRLCDAAAPDQILTSELVRELVEPRRRFAFAEAGSLVLKGLAEPIPAVEVLGEAAGAEGEGDQDQAAVSPYKGLVPFERGDTEMFFGRDAVVAGLVERLASARLVAVVGGSGSGKSSVLRAGLLPALGNDLLAGSAGWPVVLMDPGPHPLAELAARLSLHAGVTASALLNDLGDDIRALDLAARQLVASSARGTRMLVVVDQFEELFTQCRDEAERRQFVAALVHAASVTGGITTVVLAIRADFFGHCTAFAELARLVEAGTALLTPMSRDEMAAVIEGPARAAGYRLEPGLTDVLLGDLADAPGALPLLSHSLLETWKRRRGRMLTHSGYRDAGGVHGAIARTAEAVYESLDPTGQALARSVFVRLTELGEGTEDTRRRVAAAELATGLDNTEGPLASLLQTLTEARLVTVGDAGVELAHEALIREWPRLRGWLDEGREGLRIHRHLTHAAGDWADLGRDAADLYRGPRLAAAVEWADGAGDAALNPLERKFLAASHARQQQEEREREGQVRRLRRLLAGVALALAIALVAGTVALVQRQRADEQATAARDATVRADVGRLVAESQVLRDQDRYLSALLALEANRRSDTAVTRGALFSALADEPRLQLATSGGGGDYFGVVTIPPGHLFAGRGTDAVDIFDMRTGRLSRSIEVQFGAGLTASPDGTLLATGSQDGTVTIWDVTTRQQVGPAISLASSPRGLAFSHDGRRLLTSEGGRGTSDATPEAIAEAKVQVWDVATRTPVGRPLSGHTAPVNAAAYSPDGRFLATGGVDSTVVLRDAETGAALGPHLSTGAGAVVQLEFSPDSRRLGVGTYGGGAGVFDVDARTRLTSYPGGILGPAIKVRFSPDGDRIATLADTARVWDAATFASIGRLIDPQVGYFDGAFDSSGKLAIAGTSGIVGSWDPLGHPRIAAPVPGSAHWGAVFSPDGAVLAVPDVDQVVLYDPATLEPRGPPLLVEPTGLDLPARVAFSPDSRVLAASGGAGTIHRYDVATLEPVGEPVEVDSPPFNLAFSPDGELLAAGSGDDTVTLVDTETGAAHEPQRLGFSGFVDVKFSPDGRRLVATGVAGNASVFDLGRDRPNPRHVAEYRNQITKLAFSPDGRLAVTSDHAGSLQFRDPQTFAPVGAPVAGNGTEVFRLAFSPDGRLVVAGDASGATRLVDVVTRQPLGDPLPASPGDYVTFTPDGSKMATSSDAATLLWDMDLQVWRDRACEIAGRNLTPAERHEYLPNDPDATPTCPRYPET